MDKKEANTILLIKSSANFDAVWITSMILAIPILILTQFQNIIYAVVIVVLGLITCFYAYKKTSKKIPALRLMENNLKITNTVIEYDEIEYFQFISYKADKRLAIDRNWWTPRILQLHIKLKNGKTAWQSIPNQLGNYKSLKQEIRTAFKAKHILEKKEKIR